MPGCCWAQRGSQNLAQTRLVEPGARPQRGADARARAARRDNTKLFVRLLVLGCRWAEGRVAAAGQLEALLNQTASFRPAAQLLELLICARPARRQD